MFSLKRLVCLLAVMCLAVLVGHARADEASATAAYDMAKKYSESVFQDYTTSANDVIDTGARYDSLILRWNAAKGKLTDADRAKGALCFSDALTAYENAVSSLNDSPDFMKAGNNQLPIAKTFLDIKEWDSAETTASYATYQYCIAETYLSMCDSYVFASDGHLNDAESWVIYAEMQ